MYLVLLVLIRSIFGAQSSSERFWPLVQEVEGHLAANFRNVSEAVLLVGGPGTGKTSLAMLLAADPSLTTERSTAGNLLSDGGRKINRPTILPNFMRDAETGVVLVDCPSPTELEEEFSAAEFATIKVLSLLKRVKVLVVENHFGLVEGGDKEGGNRVKKAVRRFGEVAAVVATKGDNNIDGVFGPKIDAQVVQFPRPFRPGSPLTTLQQTSLSIRKILANVEWNNELKLKPSERMSCFLRKLISRISIEFAQAFAKFMSEAKVNGLKSVETATNRHNASAALTARMSALQSLNYSDLVASLRDFNASSERLDSLAKQLDWMHDAAEIKIPRDEIDSALERVIKEFDKLHRFYEFLGDTQTTLREYKYLKNRGHLAELLQDFTTFDSLVMSLAALDLQPRPQLLGLPLLHWMKHDLDDVFSKKLKFEDWSVENGVVAAAPYVLLSEAAKKYEGRNKPIVLMASQIIFIDQNLTLENGEDLIIIAPEVQIVGDNVTLDLKGVIGWSRVDVPLQGDGLAGGAGGNAGNLLIFCTQLIGAEKLLVRSSGGDGGAGQEGAPAMQGILQTEEALNFLEPFKNISALNNKTTGLIQLAFREQKFAPRSAGAGGVGGQGGYPGSVLIYAKDGELVTEVQIYRKKGTNGPPGSGGKGAAAEAKFIFSISDCYGQAEACQIIASGKSVEMIPGLEQGVAGLSILGFESAIEPAGLALRRYLYLYVGAILSKKLEAEEEAAVVDLVQRLPDLIREKGGQIDQGGLEQLEAEWAVMEKDKDEMQKTLGRHLPLMHHLLLAYAEQAPGGRRLSELIKQKSQK